MDQILVNIAQTINSKSLKTTHVRQLVPINFTLKIQPGSAIIVMVVVLNATAVVLKTVYLVIQQVL